MAHVRTLAPEAVAVAFGERVASKCIHQLTDSFEVKAVLKKRERLPVQ